MIKSGRESVKGRVTSVEWKVGNRERKKKNMKRKITVRTLCAVLFALCPSAQAQQTGKVPRIGFLDNGTASSIAVRLEAFRQELTKLGWIEGKSIIIEYRFAERKD